MPRMLLFTCLALFLDTSFAAIIAPLLPHYARELEVGPKAAGVLVAAYPAGTLVATVPAVILTPQLGYRRLVVWALVGLALATLAFAASAGYGVLVASRAVQGLGGGIVWGVALAWLSSTTAPNHSVRTLGTAFSAAVAGSLVGPALGSLAAAGHPSWVFGAVGIAAAFLAAFAATLPNAPAPVSRRTPPRWWRDRGFPLGLWLVVLFGVAAGSYTVLAPLHFASLGASPAVIGVAFSLAAAASAIVTPLVGRYADRRGSLTAARPLLALAAGLLLLQPLTEGRVTLTATLILGLAALAPLWPLGAAMLTAACDRAGVTPTIAFACSSAAWSLGELSGAAGSGVIAASASDQLAFGLLAAMCLITFAASTRRSAASYTPPLGTNEQQPSSGGMRDGENASAR